MKTIFNLRTFLAVTLLLTSPLFSQLEKVEHKPVPKKMVDFGDLGTGPYKRLVIRNVMVIPGHGGPATGPYDILVTGNVISEMRGHNPDEPTRMKGDQIGRAHV